MTYWFIFDSENRYYTYETMMFVSMNRIMFNDSIIGHYHINIVNIVETSFQSDEVSVIDIL